MRSCYAVGRTNRACFRFDPDRLLLEVAHRAPVAGIVVAIELISISLICKCFLAVSLRASLLRGALGGAMIVGVVLGNA